MKLNTYLENILTEIKTEKEKKAGITFIDIDETVFKTKAKILVQKGGKTVKKLSNQEFNSYELKKGEEYNFKQFRDAAFFKNTSTPITKRIKKIIESEKGVESRGSRMEFLTARASFDFKDIFLDAFRNQGINIDNKNIYYVIRAGDIKEGDIPTKKANKIRERLNKGKYSRVRLIDDHEGNVLEFLKLQEEYPGIRFVGLWVHDEKGNYEELHLGKSKHRSDRPSRASRRKAKKEPKAKSEK